MKHRWAALLIVLTSGVLIAGRGLGQQTGTQPPPVQRMAGSLGQNHPNPFNPTTTIPFSIGMAGNPPACVDPAKQHRVTLRIHNVLTHPIAVPILQGGGDKAGQPVERVVLGCGNYTAWWDGTITRTGQTVSSGTYIYILEVDGAMTHKRMFVAK